MLSNELATQIKSHDEGYPLDHGIFTSIKTLLRVKI